MKKCAKCGADNSPESLKCSSCSAPLEPTGQPIDPRPPVAGPALVNNYRTNVAGPAAVDNVIRSGGPLGGEEESTEPISEVGRPLNYQSQQTPQGGYGGPRTDAYGTTVGPPRLRYHETPDAPPVKYSIIAQYVGPILTLLIVLAVGGFVYWKYVHLPKGPVAAMRTFIPAAINNDLPTLQTCLTQKSQVYLQDALKRQRMGRGTVDFDFFHGRNVGFDEGREYVLKVQYVKPNEAKVLVKPGPAPIDEFSEENLPGRFKEGLPFVLVKEGEQWKIDLVQFVNGMTSTAQTGVSASGYPM